jgi:hypothetical protein
LGEDQGAQTERRKPMNKKRLFPAIGLAFVFALTILMANQVKLNAQECRIFRIHDLRSTPEVSKITIEPQTIYTSKGACVIWINWIPNQDVKIIFEDGKKCDDVTDAAFSFKLDANSCYLTDTAIPSGGTASLRFREEGTFEFAVESKNGLKEKGKIVVR